MASLVNRISHAPTAAGVYFFKNHRGRILYIGKAANLKARLRSHFRQRHKQNTLYEKIAEINWQETESEIAALVLEAQLIKKHKPQYNVMFRDDKNYFFVGFTKKEYPKVIITHQPFAFAQNQKQKTKDQKHKLIGPFTSGEELKTALRLLRKVFPYCTCKEKHKRPCLPWHLERCLGVCCLDPKRLPTYAKQLLEVEPPPIDSEDKGSTSLKLAATKKREYQRNIRNLKEILWGHTPRLLARLKREMAHASKGSRFEEAAKLRDQIEALESTLAHAKLLTRTQRPAEEGQTLISGLKALQDILNLAQEPIRIEAYDISNIQGKFATGSMVVFEGSRPKKSDYRVFRIKTVQGANDVAMLKEVFSRRLKHPEWPLPDVIIVDGGKGQMNALKTICVRLNLTQMPILGFAKGKERKGTDLHLPGNRAVAFTALPEPLRNLLTHLDNEAHRFAIKYYRKLHRREMKPQ